MKTHSRLLALPVAVAAMVAGTLAVAAPAQAADITVNDMAALKSAAASCTDGSTITLGSDIETVIVPPSSYSADEVATGCSMTLDLNDHRLSLGRVLVGEDTTLTIRGGSTGNGTLEATAGDYNRAAIDTTDAALVIDSGTVDAKVGSFAAAIGSSYDGNPGSITINGGTVRADSNELSAAIGGGLLSQGGTVTINGGTVTAVGRNGGTGIGSGESGGNGAISINGGTVVATGDGGAGIGAGSLESSSPRGPIHIAGGTVVATGGYRSSPGIGGSGQSVTIGAGADVTAMGGYGPDRKQFSAIGGDGTALRPFGSLVVGGTLHIPSEAQLTVPDGETASVTSTGLITGSTGQVDGGTLYGPGTIANTGSIRLPDEQVVDSTTPVRITDHHYAVTFDTRGGSAAPSPVSVFARSFADGGRTFPADPTRTDAPFTGWNSRADGSGVPITAASTLPGAATGEPLAVTAYAQYGALVPSISGTVREGRTLTASTDLPAGTAATYRWKADGRSITGATGPTLKLGRKQAARRVTVTVTAGGRSSTSKATKIVTSKRARIVVTPTRIGKRDYFSVTAVGLNGRQKIRVWLGGRRVLIGKADSRGVVDRTVRFSKATDAGKRRVRVSGYSSKDKRTYTITRTVRYLSR